MQQRSNPQKKVDDGTFRQSWNDTGQKEEESSYLSKGNRVVEEGMGLEDSGW